MMALITGDHLIVIASMAKQSEHLDLPLRGMKAKIKYHSPPLGVIRDDGLDGLMTDSRNPILIVNICLVESRDADL